MANTPFQIGLDLRALDPSFKAHAQRGTGTYVRELTTRLLKNEDPNFVFTPLTRESLGLKSWQLNLLNNLPRGKVTFESQICLRKNIKDTNCEAVHFFSHGDAPAFPLIPQIVTILDLIPLKFPVLYQTKDLNLRYKLARYLENKAALSAKGIIAISEATKRDIVEILNIPKDKVFVTYLGVNEAYFNEPSLSVEESLKLKNKYNIPLEDNLALYVGGLDARKNITFLLDVIKELNKSQTKTHLVLIGDHTKEKSYKEIENYIQKNDIKSHVTFTGFVESATLRQFLKISDIFLFPSLYEGFGLPVLEAMASQTLVLAGNNSCMPEVLKNRELLLEDNNLHTWTRKIKDLVSLKKQNHSSIKEILKYNLEIARNFTWDKTAKQTIEAYREIGLSLKLK